MSYVVDTHALLWYFEADKRPSERAKTVLISTKEALYIPATVLSECLWLIEHGRTTIPNVQLLLSALAEDKRIKHVPLNYNFVTATVGLASVKEIPDRQIVATTIALSRTDPELSLITNDRTITASRLVAVVW